jgi:hypothetical protein
MTHLSFFTEFNISELLTDSIKPFFKYKLYREENCLIDEMQLHIFISTAMLIIEARHTVFSNIVL